MNHRRILGIGGALLALVLAATSSAQILPPLPSLTSVTVSPASVTGGSPATGTVRLNLPAPPIIGALVRLSSNNPAVTVPANVLVLPGLTSATTGISTRPVATPTQVTVSALFGVLTKTAVLTVLPPILSSLGLSAENVTGGSPSTGTVTLNGPAPAGGRVVTLSSNNEAATVPASVTVPAGATSAIFSVITSAVATPTPVTISASNGGATQTTLLNVLPLPLPLLSSLTLSPASVTGGSPAAGTVTLDGLAPLGGALVALSSSNPAVTVPASILVLPGLTNATSSLTTSPVATPTPVTISALYGVLTRTAVLTILPPIISSLGLSAENVTGGNPATGTVRLNGPAPEGGERVTLSSSNPAVLVPDSVTVPAGATSAIFNLLTTAVAVPTPVTIVASHAGGTLTSLLTVLPSIVLNKIDPALLALMQTDPLAHRPVIVEMQHLLPPFIGGNVGRALEALQLILANGGIRIAGLPLIDSAAGFANAATISALSLLPTVAFIHHDRTVGPRQTAAPPPPTPPDQVSGSYSRIVRAHQAWEEGITGSGVTVAVLDSGVAPDLDLVAPANRLLASVNFADQAQTSDPGGHGTHIAGIIAGNGSRSGGEFVGVAPQANIVDVRVLGSTGSGRVSSVVRGIEWALAHRTTYNIRVINLSFGARTTLSYRADPLSTAVEIAWRRGMVVVAAAGNEGPEPGTVLTPGINPYVITAGATDDRGTRNRNDDVFAWFSAWGSAGSNPKPDLLAPGRRLAAVRTPGSTLDTLYPERVVAAENGSTYFYLSGTSMATGVVSGAAALFLQRNPNRTPDQVKAYLVAKTQPYGDESGQCVPDPIADGSGLLDAYKATRSAALGQPVPAVNTGLRPSDGFARAMYPVLYGTPVRRKDGSLFDWVSIAWDSIAWDSIAWDSIAWDSVAWDSVAWDSVAWDSVAWDSVAWDSVAWDTYTLD